MVDNAPLFKVGEDILKNAETVAVELSEDVIPGDPLNVTGANSDGSEIASVITDIADDVKYLAMESGLAGEMASVMKRGRMKYVFGAAFASGARLEFTLANKVIVSAGTNFQKATAVHASTGDLDEGFIDFDGGITPA